MRRDDPTARRAVPVALAVWLALAVAGCDDWFTDPGHGGDAFLFSVGEMLPVWVDAGTGAPEVAVRVRTEESYTCARLDASVERQDDVITVTIGEVDTGIVCVAIYAPGPAVFASPLPLAEGEYVLRVRRGVRTDVHRLIVGADAIEVEEGSRLAARPEFARVWRYPRPSVAIFCSKEMARAWACAALREEVAAEAGLIPVTFPPGDGTPYSELDPPGTAWQRTVYRYAGSEDLDAVAAALRAAASRYPDALAFAVDWRNRSVHP